jgi:hypothetical protein
LLWVLLDGTGGVIPAVAENMLHSRAIKIQEIHSNITRAAAAAAAATTNQPTNQPTNKQTKQENLQGNFYVFVIFGMCTERVNRRRQINHKYEYRKPQDT